MYRLVLPVSHCDCPVTLVDHQAVCDAHLALLRWQLVLGVEGAVLVEPQHAAVAVAIRDQEGAVIEEGNLRQAATVLP